MKCPFRTITIEKQLCTEMGKVISVDFAECIKSECPYYGETVIRQRAMGGFEAVTEPKCRRADNAEIH